MRCPDCNKFVPYDEPQVEEQNCDVSDGEVQGEVRVVLTCAECGTELKEHSFEIAHAIEHECDPAAYEEHQASLEEDDRTSEDEDPTYELVSSDNWNPSDYYEDKDRNGKPIKNPRYQKHYYGFEGTVTVQCSKCGEEFEVEIKDHEQASGFDECC